VTVELGEKEPGEEESSFWNDPIIQIAPPMVFSAGGVDADRIARDVREKLEKHFKASDGTNLQDIMKSITDMVPGIEKEVRETVTKHLGPAGTGKKDRKVASSTVSSHVSTISSSDDDKTATLSIVNGEKKLTVQDKDGKTIFDGPVTTDEQRKALSKDVTEVLEKLEKKSGGMDVKLDAFMIAG